jgi:hypothetical protein
MNQLPQPASVDFEKLIRQASALGVPIARWNGLRHQVIEPRPIFGVVR